MRIYLTDVRLEPRDERLTFCGRAREASDGARVALQLRTDDADPWQTLATSVVEDGRWSIPGDRHEHGSSRVVALDGPDVVARSQELVWTGDGGVDVGAPEAPPWDAEDS